MATATGETIFMTIGFGVARAEGGGREIVGADIVGACAEIRP